MSSNGNEEQRPSSYSKKVHPIIDFSEVSHSKDEIILPYLLSLKINPLFGFFSENFNSKFKPS